MLSYKNWFSWIENTSQQNFNIKKAAESSPLLQHSQSSRSFFYGSDAAIRTAPANSQSQKTKTAEIQLENRRKYLQHKKIINHLIQEHRSQIDLSFSFTYKNKIYQGEYYQSTFSKKNCLTDTSSAQLKKETTLIALLEALDDESRKVDDDTYRHLISLQYQLANCTHPEIAVHHEKFMQVLSKTKTLMNNYKALNAQHNTIEFDVELFLEFKMLVGFPAMLSQLENNDTRYALEVYFYLATTYQDTHAYKWVNQTRETILIAIHKQNFPSTTLLQQLSDMEFIKKVITRDSDPNELSPIAIAINSIQTDSDSSISTLSSDGNKKTLSWSEKVDQINTYQSASDDGYDDQEQIEGEVIAEEDEDEELGEEFKAAKKNTDLNASSLTSQLSIFSFSGLEAEESEYSCNSQPDDDNCCHQLGCNIS